MAVASVPSSALIDEVSTKVVAGKIRSDSDRPQKVSMKLNGVPIVSSPGVKVEGQDVQHFRFNLNEVWKYMGAADRLSVEFDGTVVPIADGLKMPSGKGQASSAEELFEKLKSGYVFNQKGKLQLSKTVDVKWQNDVFALYNRLSQDLAKMGVELVVCYGTMLGARRSGGFIGHDHDFDSAFISQFTDPVGARNELVDIGIALSRLGYRVNPKLTCLWITDPVSKLTIDLFHLYFDDQGKLQFPFGIAGRRAFTREDFTGYTDLSISGRAVRAIANTDLLLEYIYGSSWETPNSGFNWDLDRTEAASAGKLWKSERDRVYWSDFYLNNELDQPSELAATFGPGQHIKSAVVDLGCGNGRDSHYFATLGKSVFGIDQSPEAISRAKGRADAGVAYAPQFKCGSFLKKGTVASLAEEARDTVTGGTITFYGRFILHLLADKDEDSLFKAITQASQPGDTVVLEFRTVQDEKKKKWAAYYGRRYIEADAIALKLKRLKFETILRQTGTGFSTFRTENPELGRIVAVKR